jgi:hypothetical protein
VSKHHERGPPYLQCKSLLEKNYMELKTSNLIKQTYKRAGNSISSSTFPPFQFNTVQGLKTQRHFSIFYKYSTAEVAIIILPTKLNLVAYNHTVSIIY